ncbi:TetR/AcrR family transcriptional regulator [Nocardia callitridis]|uniref:TetR/AcrR family transcriptional regulator n=1 Tax=Nocardia callitridis TaxID=648753 RepID=A0ABP9K393_9NOCA
MTRASSGTYRGTSSAQRRAERRRRLLDAALDIIGTQGLSALTVRGVCEQGRVGPRFFYEAFPDLDTLAVELLREIQEAALDSARKAIANTEGEPGDRLRAGVTALVTDLTDDPRRAQLIFAQAHGSETLMRSRFEGMRRISETIIEQTHLVLSDELPADSDTALSATSRLITGGAAELVLVWLDGGLEVDRDGLIALLADFTISMIERVPGLARRLPDRAAALHTNTPDSAAR